MKNKFLKTAFVTALTLFAGYNIYNLQFTKNELSDLALANVEALAIGELTPEGWSCFSQFYDDTSSDLFVVIIRCTDCNTISVTYCDSKSHCWH